MNLPFLERKALSLFSTGFTSAGPRAATSVPHARAKRPRPPSTDAPRRLPAVWPVRWLPATIRTAPWRVVSGQAGPAIEARAGDTLQIDFKNSLSADTNLHFHGLHVSPTG